MDVVTTLYTQLLLRDILGYITPGLIVCTAITIALAGDARKAIVVARKMPVLMLIPLVGVAYIIGFGMQHLTFDGLGLFAYSDLPTPLAHVHRIVDFNAALGAVDDRTANGWFLQRERLVVLKHLSANGLTAIVVATVILLPPRLRGMTWPSRVAWPLGLALLCVGLTIGHKETRRKQGDLEQKAVERAEEIKEQKAQQQPAPGK